MNLDYCCCRTIAEEEDNLELVLTKAFLEVDKALARHLHFSADGRSHCIHMVLKACMLHKQNSCLSCWLRSFKLLHNLQQSQENVCEQKEKDKADFQGIVHRRLLGSVKCVHFKLDITWKYIIGVGKKNGYLNLHWFPKNLISVTWSETSKTAY